MTAQHKRPGRTARRRRQERALERLANRRDVLESYRARYRAYEYEYSWGDEDRRVCRELSILSYSTSQPLLPVPAKQSRRPVR